MSTTSQWNVGSYIPDPIYHAHFLSLSSLRILHSALIFLLRPCWDLNLIIHIRVDGMNMCVLSHFSRLWLCATLWTVNLQSPLSMGFSRQEYWRGLPYPPPGNLPNPGIEPAYLKSPTLAGRFFATSATCEALEVFHGCFSVSPSWFSCDQWYYHSPHAAAAAAAKSLQSYSTLCDP